MAMEPKISTGQEVRAIRSMSIRNPGMLASSSGLLKGDIDDGMDPVPEGDRDAPDQLALSRTRTSGRLNTAGSMAFGPVPSARATSSRAEQDDMPPVAAFNCREFQQPRQVVPADAGCVQQTLEELSTLLEEVCSNVRCRHEMVPDPKLRFCPRCGTEVFQVNDCVYFETQDGHLEQGTIKYKGMRVSKVGEWYGVALENPIGVNEGGNDGTENDIRFFTCLRKHGVFCRRDRLKPLSASSGASWARRRTFGRGRDWRACEVTRPAGSHKEVTSAPRLDYKRSFSSCKPEVQHDHISRLDGQHPWVPESMTNGEWLQIDLDRAMPVLGVVMQGDPKDIMDYVAVCSIKYSLTGKAYSWNTLEGALTWEDHPRVDVDTKAVWVFSHYVSARSIRFVPLDGKGRGSMRAGLLVGEKVHGTFPHRRKGEVPESHVVRLYGEEEILDMEHSVYSIKYAWYGDPEKERSHRGKDVTSELRRLVQAQDHGGIRASDKLFGDPVPELAKKMLLVEIAVTEQEIVVEPGASLAPLRDEYSVRRAWYGDRRHPWSEEDGVGKVVTERVRNLLADGKPVQASPAMFDEPTPGDDKVLLVEILPADQDDAPKWTMSKWLSSLNLNGVLADALMRDIGHLGGQRVHLQVWKRIGLQDPVEGPKVVRRLLERCNTIDLLSTELYKGAKELTKLGAASSTELNDKFVQADGTFELSFGNLNTFFGGLERLIGSPSTRLLEEMEREHCASKDSLVEFSTGNYDIATCSKIEWDFVVNWDQTPPSGWPREKKAGHTHYREPQPIKTGGIRSRWDVVNEQLRELGEPELRVEEVIGLRLYTGPMFMKYNAALRGGARDENNPQSPAMKSKFQKLCGDNRYTTTLHVINSGIVKLGKVLKGSNVYRGTAGGTLPKEFWTKNRYGFCGGVEFAFMSTTTDRVVAMQYASGGVAGTLLEIKMGMVDRGADLHWLSQYPYEREICFAPLTGLQVLNTRVERNVLVVEMRLNVNLQAMTIEQVMAKRHKVVEDMCDGLALEVCRGVDNIVDGWCKVRDEKEKHEQKLKLRKELDTETAKVTPDQSTLRRLRTKLSSLEEHNVIARHNSTISVQTSIAPEPLVAGEEPVSWGAFKDCFEKLAREKLREVVKPAREKGDKGDNSMQACVEGGGLGWSPEAGEETRKKDFNIDEVFQGAITQAMAIKQSFFLLDKDVKRWVEEDMKGEDQKHALAMLEELSDQGVDVRDILVPRLRKLNADSNQSPEVWAKVMNIQLRDAPRLNLSGAKHIFHGRAAIGTFGVMLQTNRGLRFLSVSGCNINDSSGESLIKALCSNSALEVVDFSNNPLGKAGAAFQSLLRSSTSRSKIAALNIAQTFLTASAKVGIAKALEGNTTLETLIMFDNGDPDDKPVALIEQPLAEDFGQTLLASLRGREAKLKCLRVEKCGLDEETLRQLRSCLSSPEDLRE